MKKLLLFMVAMLLSVCVTNSYAITAITVDGINYRVINDTVATVRHSTPIITVDNVVIPSTITHEGNVYSVAGIDNSAFEGCRDLISVTIPNSIVRIEPNAFNQCSSLSVVVFEENSRLEHIGINAFFGCESLTSINIPEGVKTIDAEAFSRTGLTSFNIPASVTSIVTVVFRECQNLKTISVNWQIPLNINHNLVCCNHEEIKLIVPNGTYQAYADAIYSWGRFQIEEAEKQDQTITFANIPAKTFGDAPFTLSAISSSGLPITYSSSNTAVATITGNTVTITGVGTTTITASQAGNNNYNPSISVLRGLTVNPNGNPITFDSIPTKTYGDAPFPLPVTWSAFGSTGSSSAQSNNPMVASVERDSIFIRGAGTATITARQFISGIGNVEVSQTIIVEKANITLDPISNKQVGECFSLPKNIIIKNMYIAVLYSSSDTTVANVLNRQYDNLICTLVDGETNINITATINNYTFNQNYNILPILLTVEPVDSWCNNIIDTVFQETFTNVMWQYKCTDISVANIPSTGSISSDYVYAGNKNCAPTNAPPYYLNKNVLYIEDGEYAIVKQSADGGYWGVQASSEPDMFEHTSNGGGMLLVNAGEATQDSYFYRFSANLDANTDYEFSAWVASAAPNGTIPINVILQISDSTGNIIEEYATGQIRDSFWRRGKIIFSTGDNSGEYTFKLLNGINQSGSGNDVLIDDIILTACRTTDSVVVSDFIIENGVLIGYIGAGGDIVIPDNVTTINYCALYNSNITSITIPSSVIYMITDSCFSSNLVEFNVAYDNPNYSSENGVLFNKDKSILYHYPKSKIGSYIIPESVTNINYYAFYRCDSLTAITIPESVTDIENGCLFYCSNLDTIKVFWEEPPISFGQYFYGFEEIASSCILSVPKGTKEAYQNTEIWKKFNIIERESVWEDNITVEPQEYSVTITWQQIFDAVGYTLTIYSDSDLTQVVATITFNASGVVINVFRTASVEDYFYTVDNLLSGVKYYYELTANNANDEVLDKTVGDFTTLGSTTNIAEASVSDFRIYVTNNTIIIENAENQPIKIIDTIGRVLVAKTLTSSIEQFKVSKNGIYIVILGGKSQKILFQ